MRVQPAPAIQSPELSAPLPSCPGYGLGLLREHYGNVLETEVPVDPVEVIRKGNGGVRLDWNVETLSQLESLAAPGSGSTTRPAPETAANAPQEARQY